MVLITLGKNNYMMIITGTSMVKIMVEIGNNFEPICSPSVGKVFKQKYFDDHVFFVTSRCF